MNKKPNLLRRDFIKKSAAAIGAFTIIPHHVFSKKFTPPSDKITLGFIGLGKQSGGLANNFIRKEECQVLAGCDVWIPKLKWFKNHVISKYAEHHEITGYNSLSLYNEYQQLLARDDIDAIVIATPDHWHAKLAIDSMNAGKDVYCEKPLTLTVDEGKKLVKKAEEKKAVFQTGSMQRSWRDFRHACELTVNGYIGNISKVLVNVGQPAIPYNLQEEAIPDGVNWNNWCGPSPVCAYNHRLAPMRNNVDFWPDWRLYEGYGGGILTDWGAHMFDIAQWGLGMDDSGPVHFSPPKEKSAEKGLRMVYQNGIEMVHQDFEKGYAVRFIGSEGTLDVSRDVLETDPINIATAEIKAGDTRLYHSDDHYQDWVDAIKARSQPICPASVGHRSASIGNLANIAYKLGRDLQWNPQREEFVKDREANKLLGRKYRRGYRI